MFIKEQKQMFMWLIFKIEKKNIPVYILNFAYLVFPLPLHPPLLPISCNASVTSDTHRHAFSDAPTAI